MFVCDDGDGRLGANATTHRRARAIIMYMQSLNCNNLRPQALQVLWPRMKGVETPTIPLSLSDVAVIPPHYQPTPNVGNTLYDTPVLQCVGHPVGGTHTEATFLLVYWYGIDPFSVNGAILLTQTPCFSVLYQEACVHHPCLHWN
jgi:hypothetical protein